MAKFKTPRGIPNRVGAKLFALTPFAQVAISINALTVYSAEPHIILDKK